MAPLHPMNEIRNRNASLVVAIPPRVVETFCMGRSPSVVILPADGAMIIRASVRRVQSIRGTL